MPKVSRLERSSVQTEGSGLQPVHRPSLGAPPSAQPRGQGQGRTHRFRTCGCVWCTDAALPCGDCFWCAAGWGLSLAGTAAGVVTRHRQVRNVLMSRVPAVQRGGAGPRGTTRSFRRSAHRGPDVPASSAPAPGTERGRPITIHRETTFLVTDEVGNVPVGAEFGLYSEDTRVLSRYQLTLDGQHPIVLTARAMEHDTAAHFLSNPALQHVPWGQLGVVRRRSIGHGLHEDLEVTHHGDREAMFSLELAFEADFAHIFEVKQGIEALGQPERPVSVSASAPDGLSRIYRNPRAGRCAHLAVRLSELPEWVPGGCRFAVRLAPREQWRLCIDLWPTATEECRPSPRLCRQDDPSAGASARRRRQPVTPTPSLRTDSYVLQRAYEQAVRDFAALRMRGALVSQGECVIAAGIPWFMALFGRDSLIAAYQTLPFYPDIAKGVLRALARRQGTRVDRVRGEEPGKILHEHRYGSPPAPQAQGIPGFPYFGSVDATPLFLVLLAATYRLTGDLALVRTLRRSALRALDWLEHYGDRDGDGYLEYLRETDRGLENQGWKDSWDAVRFRDGTVARAPIALCEVQGYAYAARVGMAEVFEALGEPERAGRLRATAEVLKEAFNRDFWLPERGYYAEALDADKRPVDSLTSNPGHLLWTGLVDDARASLVAERLLGEELFSGWGVRTMGTAERGYSPISYHCGSVWPHDNSLIVAGLARYGFREQAIQLVDGLLAAAAHYPDYRPPELFAGYSAAEAPLPVAYPTPCQPQAWATGSIFLVVATMLGLHVDGPGPRYRRPPYLATGVKHLQVEGIWTPRGPADVDVEGAGVDTAARIRLQRGATED
jgi:glycogen debranching enzyme